MSGRMLGKIGKIVIAAFLSCVLVEPTAAKKNGPCPKGDYWDPVMTQCSPCDSFCRAEENISCWRYCPDEARKRYPGQSCPDQRAAIAPFFDATDPWPTFKTGCKLESKLCNAGGCFCVNPSTGERTFGDLKVPPNERYNCKRKPRICLRERFAAWFKKQDVHVPSCDAKGFFEERQCNSNKCWNVKRTTGRRIKRNRRNKRVKRNKRRNMST